MPGLLRGMARTAVVAGTATAASNAVNRRQAERNAAAYERAYQQTAPPPAPAAAPQVAAPTSGDDTIARLERLAQLKAQGVLTEAEFESEKRRILG